MTPEKVKRSIERVIDEHMKAIVSCDSYERLSMKTRQEIASLVEFFCRHNAVVMLKKREAIFRGKYGQPSCRVRQQYIEMLQANSCNHGMQHTVRVEGYANYRHNMGLKPDAYEFCKPDKRIKDAFSVIDAVCHIDELAHMEYQADP